MKFIIDILYYAQSFRIYKTLMFFMNPHFWFNIYFNKDYNARFKSYWCEIFFLHIYYFESKSKKPFIIDAGVNRGYAREYFKFLYPDSEILGFEINTNLKKYSLHENVVWKGLSDRKGIVYINTDVDDVLVNTRAKGSSLAETVKLSDYINKQVDCLKLDIEGSEDKVLMDLIKTNKIRFIENIVLEYHENLCETNLSDFLKLAEKTHKAFFVHPSSDDCHFIKFTRKRFE